MNGMKFYLVEAFPQLASPAVVLDRILPLIRQSRIAGLRSKYPQVVKVMRLPVADFMQARVRLGVRRHIKVCEASIASVAGVTVVDLAVAQRRQWMANYAVRFCPIASNCALCSSLSVA